jgi:putative ABC transport system permease protein
MLVNLRHLLRTLRRSPASAAAAVLTLALTLGAGASIFAVVDAVLLTPPPYTDPDALVSVGETPIDEPMAIPRTVTYARFVAWRDRAGSLASLEASDGTTLTLTGLGAAERVSGVNVTTGFLTLLGVSPALGRLFHPDDDGQRVVVVSDTFWRAKLAADSGAVGRQIVLGSEPHTIVGVLPRRFSAVNRSDFWRPFPVARAQAAAAGFRVGVIARLTGAAAPLHLEAAHAVSRTGAQPLRVVATPIATTIAGDATRPLALLAGAAALAVLIAFINLAGLLIVRSIDRRRELAVRTALGARPSEIARQLILEAEALVVTGIAGGVLLAIWLTPIVGRLALERFGGSANADLAVSWRVIGVVAAVALACAAICGALPAWLAGRRTVIETLRRGATPPPRELTLRRALVIGEVAVAFVLLVSLALVGRSLVNMLRVNPGFDADGVLVMQVALPAARYPTPDRVVSFYSTLQRALQERLGARTVAVIDEIPLTGDRQPIVVRVRSSDAGREAIVREAGTAYFDVMRIPVVDGRPFDARDDLTMPARVVLSKALAERMFASEPPIGRRIQLAGAGDAEVIGIAGDVKHGALDRASIPALYQSAWQTASRGRHILVRASRPDADVVAAVRDEVGRLDGELPVYGGRSMRDVIARSPGVPARRVLTATFMGFALLAVVLGGIGLFGVVAHDVASRRAELALRIALGADPMRILGRTLAQGAWMVGLGLAVGGVLSIWTARALSGVVPAARSFDPLGLGAAALVLIVVGAGAALPAARRAARTDPLITLRGE